MAVADGHRDISFSHLPRACVFGVHVQALASEPMDAPLVPWSVGLEHVALQSRTAPLMRRGARGLQRFGWRVEPGDHSGGREHGRPEKAAPGLGGG